MALSKTSKVAVAGLALVTLAATAGEAFADRNQYTRQHPGDYRYYRHGGYHRGYGAGPAVAGAALGVLGAAAAGVAANNYYNGYPAYTYGEDYAPRYGYDYVPNHGYYGPY